MRIIDVEEKADDLKAALRNLVDAAVDIARTEAKLCEMLPAEAVAAIVSYVRTTHVGCPNCGKQTTASIVKDTGLCAACWRMKHAGLVA